MPPSYVTDRTYHVEGVSSASPEPAFGNEDVVFHEGKYWLAVRSGGRFHLRQMNRTTQPYRMHAKKPHGYAYRPIHASMTADDIEGATYAHDDGTHWLFAHCSPDEQIAFAAEAEAFTVAQFSVPIADANTDLGNATDSATRVAAKAKADVMQLFAILAGRRAHSMVVGQTLGHYHRDPHHDHFRDIAFASIEAERLAWIANTLRDDDYLRVQTAVSDIKTRLTSTHNIEWRHARKKRLDDAAAARGDDPVDGYEYCYVLSQTAAVITGDSNLPDPAWAFDRLRTGTIGRGLFVYSDAEPKTNSLLSWVIRFKRPIPEGTAAGADIGSVAWTQEAAYQPS